MANILVTGGGGFIGINLCKKLLDRGDHVAAIDNFITSDEENSKPLLTHPNFTLIKHDITKPMENEWKMENKVDSVYHLACPTGVPNVITLAEEMILTCSVGTKNVLDIAKEHNAKLIFTSSSEVYGDPEVFPQEEIYTGNVDPHGIRSPYEEGKRFSESLVTMYVRKYELDARIVRIFNTYGPHMSLHDTRVIPHFINQIKTGMPIAIYGNGSQTRTFCHVDDLVNGLLLAMDKGAAGEVYNLGSDEEITINDLAKLIIRHCEKQSDEAIQSTNERADQIQYISNPIEDHHRRLPSLEKIKALGWRTQITLEEGLRRTLQWYGF